MAKYRKKPVVVDAWRVPARGEVPSDELIDLVQENGWIGDDEGILIQTLEGDMLALPNDWIIKGVAGEFYPCKPDIFEQTYEKAGEDRG